MILAVIALIVSPIIMGVIGKTKRQAFERSIDGILDAVRIDYSSDGFVSPREYFYEGNNLILLTVNEETLDENVEIKGKINGKGFIYIDGKGTIHVENVCSKDYCANGTEPNVVITENVTGEIPELSKNDPMIKIKGDKTIYVNIGDTYAELGATAKTKSGQVLEYTTEITLNGGIVTSIDTTNENTYVITYKTEHQGKTVTDTRNVVVLDMKPVISITEGKESYVKEQEILMTVSAVRPNTVTSFTVEIKKDGEVIETETVNGISKTITLNETGVYEVIVTVTDNHENTNMISKTYKIDSEPPVIEFTGEITLKANEVSGFVFENDETVRVSDNTNLVTWKTEGNLNSTMGDQEITYIAVDEAGNETREIRTFHIDEADGPVLNSDSASTNGKWIKATTIKLSAEIQTENDELTEFTYQVDDGEIVNVSITNNKMMKVDVALNTTGRHTIKVTATGKHGNTTPLSLGEYLIDVTAPTVENISGNTDDWEENKTLTASLTDEHSKIKYYAFIKDSATKPAEDSAEWKEVTVSSPYNFSEIVTANGTYYLWAKDSAGNISTSKIVTVNKIDETVPTLTIINGSFTGKYDAIQALSELYKEEYGKMGGSTTCKNGDTIVNNVSDIKVAGTYSIKCIATGKNGKQSAEKTINITLNPKTFTEIMTPLLGTSVFNNDPDHNLRYIGENPNNYVYFNSNKEKYRIIGLFGENPKMIRNDSIDWFAWSTDEKNNWKTASLKTYLNTDYWYSIHKTSRDFIATYIWNLGGWDSTGITRDVMYQKERSETVYSGNPLSIPAKIGLMYPSDYAYASSGGSICNTTNLYDWEKSEVLEECAKKSWLYNDTSIQWTITPRSDNDNIVFKIHASGAVNYGGAEGTLITRPTIYLLPEVKIKSGTGTETDPYTLTL